MNGHISSMIHSKYSIADQLIFSIDVSNTLSAIADQLLCHESEETLTFLYPYAPRRKNVGSNSWNVYCWTSTVISSFSRGIQALSTSFVNLTRVLTFYRLYHQGSMLHSVHYGKGEQGKRQFRMLLF